MDRVHNQFLICKNGELTKLANFGEKHATPTIVEGSDSRTRWIFVTISVALLLIAATLFILKRTRL